MIDDGAKPCPSGASARVAAANRDLTILQNWISIAIYLSANEVLLIISVTKLLVKEQKILDIMVLTMMLNVDKKLKVDTSFFRGKEQGVGATYIGGEGVPGKLGKHRNLVLQSSRISQPTTTPQQKTKPSKGN